MPFIRHHRRNTGHWVSSTCFRSNRFISLVQPPVVAVDSRRRSPAVNTASGTGGGDYRVAREAPYGNDHTAKTDCKIRAGKLVHEPLLIPNPSNTVNPQSDSGSVVPSGGADRPSLTPHPSDPFSSEDISKSGIGYISNGNFPRPEPDIHHAQIDSAYPGDSGDELYRSQLNSNYFVDQQSYSATANIHNNNNNNNSQYINNNTGINWQSPALNADASSPTNLESYDYQLPLHLQQHGRQYAGGAPFSPYQQPGTNNNNNYDYNYSGSGLVSRQMPVTGQNQFYENPNGDVTLLDHQTQLPVPNDHLNMKPYTNSHGLEENGHYSYPYDSPQEPHIAHSMFPRQAVLPAIAPQTPPATLADLMIGNKNITEQEELELVQDLRAALGKMETEKLALLREELTDYDPYFTGCIDASTVHRTCAKHLRGINIPQKVLQQLFKLFSQNPLKPRLIRYEKMVQYLQKIVQFKGPSPNNQDSGRSSAKSHGSHLSRSVTAQSPSYARGDAKLILELEQCLRDARLSPLDVEDIRQSLAGLDRLRRSTLTRKQIEDVMQQHDLFNHLVPMMEALLDRCDKANGEYDWLMFLRFIEKAQPHATQTRSQSAAGPRSGLNGISFHTHNGLPLELPQNRFQNSLANNVMFHGDTNPNHPPPGALQSSRSSGDLLPGTKSTKSPELAVRPLAAHPGRHRRSMDPMVEVIEERLAKQSELSEVERQLDQLRVRRSQIRAGLEADARRMEGQEKVASVVEALHRMDHNKTGAVPIGRAYQVISSSNELYQLGLSDKFIRSIVDLCADDDDKFVSLDMMAKYLRKSLSIVKI